MTFEEFLPLKLNMGLSFDFGGLIHNRDLRGNLSLPLEYHKFGSDKQIDEQINKYLDAFNLTSVAHERPSSVVGGVRKAVCVARAFVHDPQVLFLDDPTTGLRGETKSRLKLMVQEARKKGQTVIIATEDSAFMKDLSPLIYDFVEQSIRPDIQRKAA
jgi:ABC-type lipoprotein export system ATPase subunit